MRVELRDEAREDLADGAADPVFSCCSTNRMMVSISIAQSPPLQISNSRQGG